jgi:type I restriction enzyme, S subunit
MSNKTEANTMKPNIKRELNPKMRFPEFRKTRAWQETRLGDVLTEHKLKSDGQCQVHSVSVHKGLVNQIEHLGRSFAASDTSNYNLVRPYDIVYTKSPTGDFPYGIVKQSTIKHSAIVSPLYGVFTPTNISIGVIIDAYFESPSRANQYLAPIAKKGAKNTLQISNETFLSKGIFLPVDEAEQEKIAAFLTNQMELIYAQARKVDTLKALKKGLMQQFFTWSGDIES